ncbi:MAG: phospholipase, partial [Sphingobacteriaceae bacterium]
MRKKGLLIVLSLFFVSVQAQDKSAFTKNLFVLNGDTLPVRILYPKNFDPSQKYPLMLFLHGRGESGNDN